LFALHYLKTNTQKHKKPKGSVALDHMISTTKQSVCIKKESDGRQTQEQKYVIKSKKNRKKNKEIKFM